MVPVLSRATCFRFRPSSKYTPPFTKIPRCAASANADTIVTGVEITMAQGQAITRITKPR